MSCGSIDSGLHSSLTHLGGTVPSSAAEGCCCGVWAVPMHASLVSGHFGASPGPQRGHLFPSQIHV